MNTKIKLSVILAAGIIILAGCNNNKTTSETEQSDTTNMKNDSMSKMNDGNMTNPDNGLMSAMNTMMGKMDAMTMTGDFDLDFANMMIDHHQGAIDMSNIELSKGTDDKMKGMAQNIITMQTKEIEMLREIIKNYKSSGMKHGEGELKKMHAEMKSKMQGMQMTGSTDKDFATMMIAHHEAAVKMFKAETANGMNDELKQMAKKGISDQTNEIAEFKAWLSANK